MKGIIVAFCALALQANSQFNFQINGGGLRVGILGNEVINIGGRNKEQTFSNSFPNDLNIPAPNIPLPNIDIPSPFAPFTAMQITPQINIQPRPIPIQPPQPQPQALIPEVNKKIIQNSEKVPEKEILNTLPNQKQSNASQLTEKVTQNSLELELKKEEKKLVKQEIQNEQESIQQVVRYDSTLRLSSPDFKKSEDGKVMIVNVSGEKQKEKQEQSEQIKQQLERKQDQRLANFIHLMPKSEKKHLQAIATERISN